MAESSQNTPMSYEELTFFRKNLPDKSGCYLFKDIKGEILYVGKAKSLKNRVNSYWRPRSPSEDHYYAEKIRKLVEKTKRIDIFVVENEMEAILLENELIKKHQPDFNVMLKDDKSFPWVQITNERFPRIRVIRNPDKHGLKHKYIGPFVGGGDLKRLLRLIRKSFPYCTCKRCIKVEKNARPCVNYQLKLCPGPCAGHISAKEYNENIDNIERMLSGEIDFVEQILTEKMNAAAGALQFEQAAVFRDRIENLKMFTVDQSIFAYDLQKESRIGHQAHPPAKSTNGTRNSDTKGKSEEPDIILKDIDVIAGKFSKTRAGMMIIHVRNGKLIGKTPYIVDLENKITSPSDFLAEFVKQHYLRADIPIPDEIILRETLPAGIQTALIKNTATKGRELAFRIPHEVDKTAGLMRIAEKNIQLLIRQKDEYDEYLRKNQIDHDSRTKIARGLAELQEILGLDDPPLIIEGFDMAHTQGTDYTGSMVCFVEGIPSKPHYRRYKVKSVDKPDDVAAMREVMGRRYRRAIKEDSLPDLVVVDGGKAQLNMADALFKSLNIEHIPHVGLVKPEGRSEIYTPPKIIRPNVDEILDLPQDSDALHIIQHLRDESHRFANAYHKKLRQKRQSKSELDEIPGVGPSRKRKLLQFFGSVKEIRKQSVEELSPVVGSKLAGVIVHYFQDHPAAKPTPAKAEKASTKLKLTKKKKNANS